MFVFEHRYLFFLQSPHWLLDLTECFGVLWSDLCVFCVLQLPRRSWPPGRSSSCPSGLASHSPTPRVTRLSAPHKCQPSTSARSEVTQSHIRITVVYSHYIALLVQEAQCHMLSASLFDCS